MSCFTHVGFYICLNNLENCKMSYTKTRLNGATKSDVATNQSIPAGRKKKCEFFEDNRQISCISIVAINR